MGLGKPKLRFKVGGKFFSYNLYCMVCAKPLINFVQTDRVRCSVGEWEPWVHGTIDMLWFQGETGEWPYGIMCDNGEWIKAPEDE